MAYKRQEDRVLAGSLNLTAPNDLLGDGEAIAMHNWRPDQVGALRSRLSRSALTPTQPALGYTRSIGMMGANRYYHSSGNVYRNATSLAASFDSLPAWFLPHAGWMWIMNRGARGRDNGTTYRAYWTPPSPSGNPALTLQAGGGLAEGQEYSYWATFVTAEGWETNPNPVEQSITITAGNNTVRVGLPAGSTAEHTHWNVYRSGNTLDNTYRVNVDPITIATTTFDDTGQDDYTDLEVTRLGLVLESDHDDAPAAAGVIGPYYDRLIAWSTASETNALFWTPKLRPHYFPADNKVLVGDDQDEIVAVTMHRAHLRIYKKRSIWRMVGDPETGQLEQTNPDCGLIGSKAICSQGGIDYFLAREGIYASDGDRVWNVTPSLHALFFGLITFNAGAYPTAVVLFDGLACMAVINSRLYLSYTDNTGSVPNFMLVGDVSNPREPRWATASFAPGNVAFTALFYEGQYGELLGSQNGITYALEYESTSESVPLKWTSGYRNQGTGDRKKTYADLVVEHTIKRNAADRTLNVLAKFDNGSTPDEDLGDLTVATTAAGAETAVSTFKIPAAGEGKKARNLAISLDGESDREVMIKGITVHYYLEPRDAFTFDTGEMDFGDPRVKGIELLELDIEADGPLTYSIRTNLPGNAIAQRKTGTIAATAGRQRVAIPCDAQAVEGHLIHLVLLASTTAAFRLHGVRYRYSLIGVWLDGSAGEVFDTHEVGVGI